MPADILPFPPTVSATPTCGWLPEGMVLMHVWHPGAVEGDPCDCGQRRYPPPDAAFLFGASDVDDSRAV